MRSSAYARLGKGSFSCYCCWWGFVVLLVFSSSYPCRWEHTCDLRTCGYKDHVMSLPSLSSWGECNYEQMGKWHDSTANELPYWGRGQCITLLYFRILIITFFSSVIITHASIFEFKSCWWSIMDIIKSLCSGREATHAYECCRIRHLVQAELSHWILNKTSTKEGRS